MKTEINHTKSRSGITLVLGGTGKTGRRVAERLADRGVQTRVASRSANPSFDWNDQGSWGAVLDGVEAAYISYAPDLAIPGATESVRDFIEMAVEQGVQRFVLLSGRGEEEAQRCERIVQDAGVEWSVPAGLIRISPKASFSAWCWMAKSRCPPATFRSPSWTLMTSPTSRSPR